MSHFTVWVDTEDATFSERSIENQMELFCECTEDTDYLEFQNMDEEYRERYKTDTVDCVRMPNGTICPVFRSAFSNLYTVENGTVYKKNYGPLHHRKRTKEAKWMQFIPEYPVKKLFRTYKRYMEDYCCYDYHEDHGAYGYYSNPNSFWDWYQIGGRWPFVFLVKKDCETCIDGERSWCTEDNRFPAAPEGYKWTADARKADIAWDVMKRCYTESSTKRFFMLESCFVESKLPEGDVFARLSEDSIVGWGEHLYKKGETLEQYLERHDLGPDCKYPCSPYGFVHNGTYSSHGDMGWWAISTNEKEETVWRDMVQKFIEELPGENLLVSLDCHV